MMRILSLSMVFLAFSMVFASSTILILDASGSMADQITGGTKMEIAKEAANEFLDNVKTGDEVALIVYYDCSNIVTEVPFTTNVDQIRTVIAGVQPDSYTPIAGAIDYAVDYAESSGRSNAASIILTDGEETCGSQSDAVTAAQNAVAGPINMVNVVGFDIDPSSTGYTNLQEIATAGQGNYYSADDADELATSLTQAYDDSTTGYSCCGPMFVLLGLVGTTVFFGTRK